MSLSISDMARTLVDGDMLRDVCPFCGGGATGETSFSLMRDGNIAKYKCFRASCDVSGMYKYTDNLVMPSRTIAQERSTHANRYTQPSLPLSTELAEYLCSKYGLSRQVLLNYTYATALDGRLIIPIRDVVGRTIGEELKSYPIKGVAGGLKSQIFIDQGVPTLSWYTRQYPVSSALTADYKQPNANTLVIVEDQISALKVSPLCHAVALMGVNLSKDKIVEIGDVQYDRVLLALDSDAFRTSIKSFRNAHALIRNLQIVRLVKDLKDTEYPRIKQIIDVY